MTITKCEVDVKQWDASFTYYLSLNAQLTLIDNDFEEPIARTLILFDNGRVWIAHEN